MDSTVPGITVYDDGTCTYCREYERRLKQISLPDEVRAKGLSSLISQIKSAGRGKRYDALIGLSGGLDSSYAAYIAVKHGLRLLGVHVDNGWDAPFAVSNIQKVCHSLGIELMIETVPWEQFRDLQIAFLKASVRNAEIPTDHVITAVLYYVASKHRIRFIISGGNFVTEGVYIPQAFGHYNQDLRFIRSVHRRFGTKPLNALPTMSILGFLYYRFVYGIRVVRILDFVDYKKKEAEELLNREIGWTPYQGKHNESVYTRFFQGYILPRKFGLDKRKLHLSALICSGQLQRDEALKELERPFYRNEQDLKSDREEVLRKLGITDEEFESIMALPPRLDSEFPTNLWIFEIARWLVRHGIRV